MTFGYILLSIAGIFASAGLFWLMSKPAPPMPKRYLVMSQEIVMGQERPPKVIACNQQAKDVQAVLGAYVLGCCAETQFSMSAEVSAKSSTMVAIKPISLRPEIPDDGLFINVWIEEHPDESD